ncbi:MAG: winged helix-turn-helix domain-containing protein [Opitutaceae bacterium]
MAKQSAAGVLVEPRFRIRYGRRLAFGPGKAGLLEHIERTGSITEAAKAMGMSYMRAWTLVKSMDQGQPEPLVRTARGGRARGGAGLTKTGREVLRLYREMETRATEATREVRSRLGKLLAP